VVVLVFLAALLVLSLIPVTVVPSAVDEVDRLNLDLQQLVDDVTEFLAQPVTVFAFTFQPLDLIGDVRGSFQSIAQPFATQTVSLLFNVASSLLWVVSIVIIAFYLIRDAGRLRAFLDRIAPPGYTEELRRLREEIMAVWKAFFRGQVVLAIIVGTMVWIAMTLVGLPNAGLMGFLAGLLEVIPTFGPILATIPAVLVAFIRGSTYLPLSNFWFALLVLGIYILIQQTENAYLVPRIQGRRMQLHPVVVFIGLLLGGMLAGVIGIFLAAPLMGTVRVLLSYIYAKLFDQPPFPPEEPQERELFPGEIDAILFDLDGTLVETDDRTVEALTRRLQAARWILPGRDPGRAARRLAATYERLTGYVLGVLDRVGLDDELLGLGDRLRQISGMHRLDTLRAVDGVGEMLYELSRHYALGIVTTRSHREAQAFLAQQGWADLVQVIAGRDDTWRIKPHPDPVRHAAEQLGVPAERCLMVGDTRVDVESARRARAWSAGVLCGFGDRADLERAGADLILETSRELSRWM
jgi:predicted PurR-regulated permease PerM/phosphoglycolate phosphatase-like HAD superfamily hydrolase